MTLPRSGDVLRLDGAASVQFADDRALTFRVIRTHDWPTYEGWVWLDGYELDRCGEAVERRSVWVRVAGVRQLGAERPSSVPARQALMRNQRRAPGRRAPVRLPGTSAPGE